MAKYDRLNRLLELLATEGHVSIEDAAARLEVSTATVRRDLDGLAEQQLLTRTHGGAVSNSTAYDLPLRYRTGLVAERKSLIAGAAAALVTTGSIVGINGGTTSTEVARALALRADADAGPESAGITVVTNALNIANELIVRGHVKLVVLGGVTRPQSYELTGPLAEPVIAQLSLDIAVLGVDAVDLERGPMSHHEADARMNSRIAGQAARVVIVADSSKLGRTAFAQICAWSQVHVLITDRDADAAFVAAVGAAGVEVIQV